MRYASVIAALSGLVSASPLERRAPCGPQPPGAPGAPVPVPNTAQGFQNSVRFDSLANSAQTPAGYSKIYTNLDASNNAPQYLTSSLINYYDPSVCAAKCNSIAGCQSFNIYFQRAPRVEPGYNQCKNPAAVVQIQCGFWGSRITAGNAVNTGSWRADFRVLIGGANGYGKIGGGGGATTTTTTTPATTPTTPVTTPTTPVTTPTTAVTTTTTPGNLVSSASSIIASNGLQGFCSSLLSYTIPTVTNTVPATTTPPLISVGVSGIATVTVGIPLPSIIPSTINLGLFPGGVLPTGGFGLGVGVNLKRDEIVARQALATPTAIATFLPPVLSSACSAVLGPAPTGTVTSITTTTVTVPARTTTVTTTTVTSTRTTTNVPACTASPASISGTRACSCEYDVSCGGFSNAACNLPVGTYTSLASCTQVCDSFLGCIAVNYNRQSGLCTICNAGVLGVLNPVLNIDLLGLNPDLSGTTSAALRRDDSCIGGLLSLTCVD